MQYHHVALLRCPYVQHAVVFCRSNPQLNTVLHNDTKKRKKSCHFAGLTRQKSPENKKVLQYKL